MNIFGGQPRRPGATGFSVVDNRLTIRGEIDTDGTVRVDGRVEGARHRAGTLIIGAGGTLVGDVEARDVVVAGSVRGSIFARGRIEIEAGGSVLGDIRANIMALREGGAVDGRLAIGGDALPAVAGRRLELADTPQATGRVLG